MNRKKKTDIFQPKLTTLVPYTTLKRFKATARRLGRSQTSLVNEALKDITKKYGESRFGELTSSRGSRRR